MSSQIELLKKFFIGMSLAMAMIAITTSVRSNIFVLPEPVVKEPWFITTLVGFYFNISIFSMWVIYKEKTIGQALAWIISFILLGSMATAFYIFCQLKKLKPGEGLEKVLLKDI